MLLGEVAPRGQFGGTSPTISYYNTVGLTAYQLNAEKTRKVGLIFARSENGRDK
jgi:hypothetical protein